MRTLYIEQNLLENPPDKCSVVSVSPLLRELILYAIEEPRLYDLNGPDGRIALVIIDSFLKLQVTPLDLPIPENPRLKKILQALVGEPADQGTLSEWANSLGMTSRTLARHLKSDTNLTFGQWRQQIRLPEALRRLGRKEAVNRVAVDLGYDSPSPHWRPARGALVFTFGFLPHPIT